MSATAAAPVLSASGPSFNDMLPSVNVAVARMEAVAGSLSPEWFAGVCSCVCACVCV